MTNNKSADELVIMQEGGRKLAKIRDFLMDFAQAGVALTHIDAKATELISQTGGEPSFRTVEGYRWATCLCVNDVVVHGLPTSYQLKAGDLITIDIGLLYKGLHTDTAWTKTIEGSGSKDLHKHFRESGELALEKAIRQFTIGNHIGEISNVIQTTIEGAGYNIVKTLVGHGVGKMLHEDPQVPGYVVGDIRKSPVISEGMTIAIEVIYTEGSSAVVYKGDDGWSIATRDGSLSAVYEQTVAATQKGPIVLTSAT